MRARLLVGAASVVALLVPATALAGAPNYDCVVDRGRGHLAIDQWTPLVVATGLVPGRSVQGGARGLTQAGARLALTTTLAGTSFTVAIAGFGRSVVVTSRGVHLTGHCTMIPGNFVLRAVDRGGHVVRAGSSSSTPRVVSLPTGGPVWQRPAGVPRGRWLPVLAVTFPGGIVTTRSGWLRQIGPYESR
jgi:hypothetical protein